MTNSLIDAVSDADAKSLKALLADGGDPNVVVNQQPALVFALAKKKKAIAKLLVAAGADVNAAGQDGTPPIIALANGVRDPGIGALLAERGLDLDARDGEDSDGLTALHIAVTKKKLDFAEWLLDAGANVDAIGKKGDTPLLWCCRSDSGEMNASELAGARLLLSRGANPNAENRREANALLLAAVSAPADFVVELIETHGTKASPGKNGDTPLHACTDTHFKDEDVWNALLDAGVDLNAQTKAGNTALLEAVSSRNLHAVKFFIDKGADPSIQNSDGETARTSAERLNREKILAFLSKRGL